MPEVKTDFGNGSSMSSGVRVIEKGCIWHAQWSHTVLPFATFILQALCHWSSLYSWKILLLQQGLSCQQEWLPTWIRPFTWCVCSELDSGQHVVQQCSGLGNTTLTLVAPECCGRDLAGQHSSSACAGWRKRPNSPCFPIPESKLAEAEKTRRHGPVHASLENKRGTPRKTSCGSTVSRVSCWCGSVSCNDCLLLPLGNADDLRDKKTQRKGKLLHKH